MFKSLMELRAPAQGIAVYISAATPLSIGGAPLALIRAFRNLMINAATHGGGAEIEVESLDARAIVVIGDRGPGIPETVSSL